MKILLMTLNSKYIHSNLAIHSIYKYYQTYTQKHYHQLEIIEFTINQNSDQILTKLFEGNYDAIFASCYIWNIEMMIPLLSNYHMISPETEIYLGGPEVSYHINEYMIKHKFISGILKGEGEATFFEMLDIPNEINKAWVKGLVYKEGNEIVNNGERLLIEHLDEIPFPYDCFDAFENRIIYYESTRGCPYQCSYCLSSDASRVRFLSVERVKRDLDVFLNAKLPQVKFIDRTFNVNKSHALFILEYINQNDNGVTNFHFEITGELLDEDYFKLLRKMRTGLVQFEIGIQSTHPETITAINRKMNQEKLFENIRTLYSMGNIHIHVDLIAGLPFDTFDTFMTAFNEVYNLSAHQFQLGFLKVLKGTPIENQTIQFQYKIRNEAPYEILENKWVSFKEMSKIKALEHLLDYYYNSGKFNMTMPYMLEKFNCKPHEFYFELHQYFNVNGWLDAAISMGSAYDYLLSFYESKFGEDRLVRNLLKYDYYYSHMKGERPFFDKPHIPAFNQLRLMFLSQTNRINELNVVYAGKSPKEILKTVSFIVFEYDIMALLSSHYHVVSEKRTVILFDYEVGPHALIASAAHDVTELLELGENIEANTHSS